jgi:lipopolysaccharide/colanic/teichoic acid biosynthesis glycosyltransferase
MNRLIGLVLAVLTAPIVLSAVALVALVDRHSPVFLHSRCGHRGQPIRVVKIRTMRPGGPLDKAATSSDPRITAVGGWLRSFRIDELPQFINVVRGDLAVVGPRPEIQSHIESLTSDDRRSLLAVMPGVTSPAALLFRNENRYLDGVRDSEAVYLSLILPEKVRLAQEYRYRRSPLLDFKIIALTMATVVGYDPTRQLEALGFELSGQGSLVWGRLGDDGG